MEFQVSEQTVIATALFQKMPTEKQDEIISMLKRLLSERETNPAAPVSTEKKD